MFQNFIIPKLSNIGLRLPVETGRWDGIPVNEQKCKICTTDDIGDEYHYLFTCDCLGVTETYIWNPPRCYKYMYMEGFLTN